MSQQSSIQRYDRQEILDEIIELIQMKGAWHGFRTRDEIIERFEEGSVSWVHNRGQVVCAATYNHRQRSHTRIYTTAMSDEAWHPDLWSRMVTGILLESPHDRIISKTPVGSNESDLWEDVAVQLREEDGLLVWEIIDGAFLEELQRW